MKTLGNAFLVSGLSILSHVLGFLSQLILAKTFGTGQEIDAYFGVLSIPSILTGIAPMVFAAVILPSLASLSPKELVRRKLANSLFWQTGILCVLVMVMGWFLSPLIVNYFFPFLSGALYANVVYTSRLIWGATGASLLVSYLSAVLNADKRFGWAALVILLPTITIIVSVLILSFLIGIRSIALGLMVGTILQIVVLLPYTFNSGVSVKLYNSLLFIHKEQWLILKRIVPVSLSMLPFTLPSFIVMYWGAKLPAGSISFLSYSQTFAGFLSVIVSYGIAIVSLPDMTEKYASGCRDDAFVLLEHRLRYVFLLATVGAALILILRIPILEIAYQHGKFSSSSVQSVANVLPWYLMGGISVACLNLLRTIYYSADKAVSLAIQGIAVAIGYFALAGSLSRWFNYEGIGMAYAASSMVWMTVVIFYIPGRRYGLWTRSLANFMFKVVIVTLISTLFTIWFQSYLFFRIPVYISMILSAGLLVMLFISLANFVFHIEEVRGLMKWPARFLAFCNRLV